MSSADQSSLPGAAVEAAQAVPGHAEPSQVSEAANVAGDEVRERIVEAAEQRFRQFGYRKTGVAEIAGDLHMSAANLYRFFANKQDIAAACASRCMGRRDALLEAVMQRSDLSPAQRLTEFVLVMLRYTHDQVMNHPTINELVETVVGERQEIVHQKIGTLRAMIANIVAEGQASGEFKLSDPGKTGETVFSALVLFAAPVFMHLYPLQELETRAIAVVNLLLDGIRKPGE